MKVLRAGAYEAFYDMPLQIDWCLTKRCNYHCSYCWYYGKGKNTPPIVPFSSLEQLRAAVNNLASLNRPWYDLIFTGGEPTLHPHMIDLIYMLNDTLQDRLNNIMVISNGSRNARLYQKIAELAKTINISMQISVHTDHVDMAHILEIIENLSSDVSLYFPLMFNPAKREEVHLIYDIMYEYRKIYPFDMEVVTIRIRDNVDPRYVPEDLLWQEEAIKRFTELKSVAKLKVPFPKKPARELHMFHDVEDKGERKIVDTENFTYNLRKGFCSFTNMFCTANTSNLRIEENGLCRSMICPYGIGLFNIYEDGAIKAVRDRFIHAIKCPKNICGCPTSNFSPKFASFQEAQKFMEIFDAKQQKLFDEYAATHAIKAI